ncbi:DEAD/DEAH box helicase [Natranaeroarchaeum aerophilus]|uniref:DEAD/DEAH box helicase n=1 Tax=Natranaeroarchaeum aerophilus TaxID=2917711 RepID=A0AAE3FSJ4_9EURY|nr:DEAD/DEAH box helicase [Natranaeroarchaeum aerophilus]MCL9814852.1 DEAD/DEAH box helicase [Natranaeroarchaeum aerophilus]
MALAEDLADFELSDFADAFAFESFNRMQQEALPGLLGSDENVVASAPTASGKTALAELAICRALANGGTALFVAPLRALTNEKEADWERFEELGYSVYVVTGERDLNPRRARRADILVMTPEKTDSATRKHDSRRYDFITDIDVCVIDEVHLLDSDRRGSVLEVTISRLRRLCEPRVVALSATMPNIDDVAAWLDAPAETTFEFGDEYRPVDLHADVRTYTHGENSFADKYRRLYRAMDLAEPHIDDGGQALVFVSSRQDTVQAAKKARDEIAERDLEMGARGEYDYHTETQQLENDTLRKSALDGVGFHHAGLSKNDKDLVEEWFRQGQIQLLFSTSTLAWGVNLPARCVVIRDTKYHDPLEGEVDMSPLDVLQMLGRAGRPGYDDVGYGWIVCDRADADKYRKLLRDGKEIESQLAEDLDAHLNAEIAMGTIRDLDDVMDWLETTFYYQRAQSAPSKYGFENLRERVRETLSELVEAGFVETDELGVDPTPLGRLASKYYLRLDTAERFHDLATAERQDVDTVLEAVATAEEFDSVNARQSERDAISAVLSGKTYTDDVDAGQRKVLAILHSSMTGSTPADLTSDAWVIRQNSVRLVSALGAFCRRFADPQTANLVRRVEARLDHGVSEGAVGLTAVDGIGSGRASKLAAEGITTPGEVIAVGVDGLVAAGLSEGVAERVIESAGELPAIEIEWGSFPDSIPHGQNEMCEVTVRTVAGNAAVGVRVTVNDIEMTADETYLSDELAVPVGVFGGDESPLEYAVEVSFPELPLLPVRDSRSVDVERP